MGHACLNERANTYAVAHRAIYATATSSDGRQRNLSPQPPSPSPTVTMTDEPAAIRPYKHCDEDDRLARFYIGLANMEGLAVANSKSVWHATI